MCFCTAMHELRLRAAFLFISVSERLLMNHLTFFLVAVQLCMCLRRTRPFHSERHWWIFWWIYPFAVACVWYLVTSKGQGSETCPACLSERNESLNRQGVERSFSSSVCDRLSLCTKLSHVERPQPALISLTHCVLVVTLFQVSDPCIVSGWMRRSHRAPCCLIL